MRAWKRPRPVDLSVLVTATESWQAGGNGQGWEVRADLLRGQGGQVTYLAEGRASENCRM